MAETPEANKPDFRNGFRFAISAMAAWCRARPTAKNWFWAAALFGNVYVGAVIG